MAKYCNICNEKIGVFEKTYNLNQFNSLCKLCYEREKSNILEKDRIKKMEIAAKKKEEERKKNLLEKQIFIKEFLNQFSNLGYIYIALNNKTCALEKNVEDLYKIKGYDLFDFLSYVMYKKIDDSESLNKVSEVFFDLDTLRKISESILQIADFNNKYGNHSMFDLFVAHVELLKKQQKFESNICNATLNSMISGDYCTETIDSVMAKSLIKGDQMTNSIRILVGILLYTNIFIRGIVLSRNVSKFVNNVDLYKMYKNLRYGTNCTIDEISKKIFPIYNEDYIDVFEDRFDELTFNSLIKMVDSYSVNIFPKESLYSTLYDDEIREYINNRETVNFKSLLEKINNNLFFDAFKFENIDVQNDVAYTALYHYIIQKTGEYIPVELFFDIVMDKFDYINLLKLKDKKNKVKLEKERFLNGDFSKEKNYEIDQLEVKNISTGYEFENYLKNVFEKLGYKSTVTKSSGDQGADLIIEKDNIKTVVQAKYYTNPVGNKAVQEVVSSIAFYNANNGMVVTNNIFTKSAIELANANSIKLIDGKELEDIKNNIIEKI